MAENNFRADRLEEAINTYGIEVNPEVNVGGSLRAVAKYSYAMQAHEGRLR